MTVVETPLTRDLGQAEPVTGCLVCGRQGFLNARGFCSGCIERSFWRLFEPVWPELQERAQALIAEEPLFIDVETSGMSKTAGVVEIAILDHHGRTHLNTLVKPKGRISQAVTRIHGISQSMVADAPMWADIWPHIRDVTHDRVCIAHNSPFDQRFVECAPEGAPRLAVRRWACSMRLTACLNYNNRWMRLAVACERVTGGLPAVVGYRRGAHGAAYDTECCRRIVVGCAV